MTTEPYNVADLLIEAILTIANDKKMVAMLEPDVMQPLELERWMITRTLQCLELILQELENVTEIPRT